MSSRSNLASFILFAALAVFANACAGGASGDNGRAVSNSAAASNGSGAESARQQANTDAANNSSAPTTGAPAASNSSVMKSAGGAQTPMPTPQVGSGGNDFFLFTKTRGVIDADAELKGSGVIVNVSNGVVTLTGNVAGEAQKGRAEQLARSVEGVTNVRNELRISKTAGPR